MYTVICLHNVGWTGAGVQLVQKKKTIFPEWNSCFDAHLYEGRVIQLVVNSRPSTKVAECSVSAQHLADKCNDGELTNVWVSIQMSAIFDRGSGGCPTFIGGKGLNDNK